MNIEQNHLNAFKPVWEGMRINSKWSLAYFPIFCYRRFLYILVLIFMDSVPAIQVLLKTCMTVVSMVYVIKVKPHDDTQMITMELFNEVCILMFDYHLLVLLQSSGIVEPEDIFNMGWSFVMVFVVFLGANMSVLIYNSVRGVYLKFKKKQAIKKAIPYVPSYEKQIKFRIGVSNRLRFFVRKQHLMKKKKR